MNRFPHAVIEPPRGVFWVFAYGSLMWQPGFAYTTCRQARLHGYRRALCVLSFAYRGTRERPGLVFGLDRGGSCVGRAFRVAGARRMEAFEYVMNREMIQGVYTPRWLPVDTPAGRVTALCFIVDRRHEQYAPALPEHRIVSLIGQAHGRRGSNIDYLFNTCRHLEELGICPRDLARIRDRVAAEHGGPAADSPAFRPRRA